jgi:hypothetical protein
VVGPAKKKNPKFFVLQVAEPRGKAQIDFPAARHTLPSARGGVLPSPAQLHGRGNQRGLGLSNAFHQGQTFCGPRSQVVEAALRQIHHFHSQVFRSFAAVPRSEQQSQQLMIT